MEDRILVARLKTNKENIFIDVNLYFNRNTLSYWTYKELKKGYYVSATPCKVCGGIREFVAFSGHRTLIEESNRFSQKKFNQLKEVALDKANFLINLVIAEQNL